MTLFGVFSHRPFGGGSGIIDHQDVSWRSRDPEDWRIVLTWELCIFYNLFKDVLISAVLLMNCLYFLEWNDSHFLKNVRCSLFFRKWINLFMSSERGISSYWNRPTYCTDTDWQLANARLPKMSFIFIINS